MHNIKRSVRAGAWSVSKTLAASIVCAVSAVGAVGIAASSTAYADEVKESTVDQAKVYWVGHSLISGSDPYELHSPSLITVLGDLARAGGKQYHYHKHTIPGAPIGWNWGVPDGKVPDLIAPLLDKSHKDYGTYNVMVVTEGVNIERTYNYWASDFYMRKFALAARAANPKARVYLYESWHHYNAGDEEYRREYGPNESYDWKAYQRKVRSVWESIADQAADPKRTRPADNYRYVYEAEFGPDPATGDDRLEIYIIPTGQVVVDVLDRLAEQRKGDDWSYAKAARNGQLSGADFFVNPLVNFPKDMKTLAHPECPAGQWDCKSGKLGTLDDIHPSHLLVYLNAVVHYSVIYQANPVGLPALYGVPDNLAKLFQEVAWARVSSDARTGVGSKP